MNRRVRTTISALVLAALAGCSTHDADAPPASASATAPATSPADAAVDAAQVRSGLAALFAGDHSTGTDRSQSRCFARELTDRVDVAQLQEAGIVGPTGGVVATLPVLDRATATAWVAAQQECADFVTASTRALTAQSKGRLDGATYRSCLESALTDEQVRAALVEALSGGMDSAEVAALATAQSTCAQGALPQD